MSNFALNFTAFPLRFQSPEYRYRIYCCHWLKFRMKNEVDIQLTSGKVMPSISNDVVLPDLKLLTCLKSIHKTI